MPLLISHNSALERLRAVPPQVDRATLNTEPIALSLANPSRNELRILAPKDLDIMQRPIHLLIPSSTRRSDSSSIVSHASSIGSLPTGSVRIIAPTIFAAGPELVFIQLARTLSELGAVVLGHELCGVYSHFAPLVSGFYNRPALTSVERISDTLEELKGSYGLAAARKALRWVRNGSASPMETVVSCMLHLPSKIGGFGLVAPALNHEVSLDQVAQRIAGKRTVRIDTAYPCIMAGLEFDGKDYHRDIEADRTRREALTHMGWHIYVLNVDEVTSYRMLRDKVALLGDVPRQRHTQEVSTRDGQLLLGRLLRATRFGIGMDAALFTVKIPRGKVQVHL